MARRIAGLAAAAVVALELAVLPAACASAQGGQTGATTSARTRAAVDTSLLRRSLDSLASEYHGTVVTTPNEMATLFELLARGRAANPGADSSMLAILEHNEDLQMLQRLADGVRAAHKTGATDAVRTECALFYLASRVVACVLTKDNVDQRWVVDTEPQVTMARMGEAIVKAWGPAPAPKTTP